MVHLPRFEQLDKHPPMSCPGKASMFKSIAGLALPKLAIGSFPTVELSLKMLFKTSLVSPKLNPTTWKVSDKYISVYENFRKKDQITFCYIDHLKTSLIIIIQIGGYIIHSSNTNHWLGLVRAICENIAYSCWLWISCCITICRSDCYIIVWLASG